MFESWGDLIRDKKDGLIQKLWEAQLEQGFNTLKGETFFYPAGTKFFYHTDATTIVVVEQQPCVRTIKYCDDDKRISGSRHTIALPYVIFCFMFNHRHHDCYCSNTACYFANEPLTSMDSKVANAALPNIHDNGAICFGVDEGQSKFRPEKSFKPTSKNIIDYVESAVAFFWGSLFNTDLNSNYNLNQIKTPSLRFDKWEKKSQQSPSFILNVKWENQKTFREALTLLPDADNRYDEDSINPVSYMEANRQLDDVYCHMMDNSRTQVEKFMDALKASPEVDNLREVFNASVEMYIQRATRQFLQRLSRNIKDLPSYRRGEVQSCIEDSLKHAMMDE